MTTIGPRTNSQPPLSPIRFLPHGRNAPCSIQHQKQGSQPLNGLAPEAGYHGELLRTLLLHVTVNRNWHSFCRYYWQQATVTLIRISCLPHCGKRHIPSSLRKCIVDGKKFSESRKSAKHHEACKCKDPQIHPDLLAENVPATMPRFASVVRRLTFRHFCSHFSSGDPKQVVFFLAKWNWGACQASTAPDASPLQRLAKDGILRCFGFLDSEASEW